MEARSDAFWARLPRAVLVFCLVWWVVEIAAGTLAYQERRVALAQLPLGWFDRVFRRVGPALPLAPLGMRALAASTSPRDGAPVGSRGNDLSRPLALYVSQGVLRGVIYHLHFTGWFFWGAVPKEATESKHGVHVMSDHILLAACVHAALVSEAYFAVEFLRRSRPGSAARLLASVALVAAVALSVLVSIESYYTSRFFHPPIEIFSAVALGAVLFHVPALRGVLPSGERQRQRQRQRQRERAQQARAGALAPST